MVSGSGVGVGLGVGVGVGVAFEVDVGVGLGVAFEVDGAVDLDVGLGVTLDVGLGVTLDVGLGVGVGIGFFVDVGLTLRCSMFQLMLYCGGGELVCTSFVDVGSWVDDGLGLVVDLKVVGLGGHGFQGGYPGFLVEETFLVEVDLLVGTEEEVCSEVLELVEIGGDDVTDGYSGVGLGVGVGIGVGVEEAPGPSPSQLML